MVGMVPIRRIKMDKGMRRKRGYVGLTHGDAVRLIRPCLVLWSLTSNPRVRHHIGTMAGLLHNTACDVRIDIYEEIIADLAAYDVAHDLPPVSEIADDGSRHVLPPKAEDQRKWQQAVDECVKGRRQRLAPVIKASGVRLDDLLAARRGSRKSVTPPVDHSRPRPVSNTGDLILIEDDPDPVVTLPSHSTPSPTPQPDDAAVQAIVAAALAKQAEDHAQAQRDAAAAHKANMDAMRADMTARMDAMRAEIDSLRTSPADEVTTLQSEIDELKANLDRIKSLANAVAVSTGNDLHDIRCRIAKVETEGSPYSRQRMVEIEVSHSSFAKERTHIYSVQRELRDDIALLKSKVEKQGLPPNAMRKTTYKYERKVQ